MRRHRLLGQFLHTRPITSVTIVLILEVLENVAEGVFLGTATYCTGTRRVGEVETAGTEGVFGAAVGAFAGYADALGERVAFGTAPASFTCGMLSLRFVFGASMDGTTFAFTANSWTKGAVSIFFTVLLVYILSSKEGASRDSRLDWGEDVEGGE